jgi:hypothetical protein
MESIAYLPSRQEMDLPLVPEGGDSGKNIANRHQLFVHLDHFADDFSPKAGIVIG